MLANAWTYTPEDALAYFGTNVETGLSDEKVKQNRSLYGENGTSPSSHKFHDPRQC